VRADDEVFDTDHKPEWDEMLKVLNFEDPAA